MISLSCLPLRQWVENLSTDFLIDRKEWGNINTIYAEFGDMLTDIRKGERE
jgi:hypothetical protein